MYATQWRAWRGKLFFFCLFISLEGAFNMQQFIIKLLLEISRRNIFQNQGKKKVLFIRESPDFKHSQSQKVPTAFTKLDCMCFVLNNMGTIKSNLAATREGLVGTKIEETVLTSPLQSSYGGRSSQVNLWKNFISEFREKHSLWHFKNCDVEAKSFQVIFSFFFFPFLNTSMMKRTYIKHTHI